MTADIKEGWEMLEVWAGKKKIVWKTVMLKSEGSSEPAKITRQNSSTCVRRLLCRQAGKSEMTGILKLSENNPTKEATSAPL